MSDIDTIINAVRIVQNKLHKDQCAPFSIGEVAALANEIESLRHDLESTDRTVCEHFNQPDKCDQCNDQYLTRLRDEFAMAALQGIIPCYGINYDNKTKTTAKNAYLLADAMMKARKEVPE